VTLRHPLRGERVETILGDGRSREGRVIGADRAVGVAVLELDTGDAPPATWAESVPAIGATVFALGNPGTGLRITEGKVSAAPLTIRSRDGRPLEVIEHTAPMPRGSGGGPLLDEHGSVLGVNALRGDPGFLLALPAASVRAAIDRIAEGREPARLGVALAPPRTSRRMRRAVGLPDRDGLLVRAVEEGSAAERAGVLAGDLLVRFGDVELKTIDDLYAALDAAAGAEPVGLRIARASEESDLSVQLGGDRH
jgi:S1-C subfamily serine protease